MALWKETPARAPAQSLAAPPAVAVSEPNKAPAVTPDSDVTRRMSSSGNAPRAPVQEALVAAGLTMEGKLGGGGDVRVAGRFQGDVGVEGNVRIDAGGRLDGQVKASAVAIGGELQGNIEAAKHIDVLGTGVIVGDVKAASITVAAGSRMRGHVEVGWDDKKP